MFMYHMICIILWFDTIYTIYILYRKIYDHFWHTFLVRNFLHTIEYVSYDIYFVLYDTNNYRLSYFTKQNKETQSKLNTEQLYCIYTRGFYFFDVHDMYAWLFNLRIS